MNPEDMDCGSAATRSKPVLRIMRGCVLAGFSTQRAHASKIETGMLSTKLKSQHCKPANLLLRNSLTA